MLRLGSGIQSFRFPQSPILVATDKPILTSFAGKESEENDLWWCPSCRSYLPSEEDVLAQFLSHATALPPRREHMTSASNCLI